MSFALTIVDLHTCLKQPGCPICAQRETVTQRYQEFFFRESDMDRKIRAGLVDALGFCPEHTRIMVAFEMRNFGDPLGTNLVYEQILHRVQRELGNWQTTTHRTPISVRRIKHKLRRGAHSAVLNPLAICPLCRTLDEAAVHSLAAMLEELDKHPEEMMTEYRQSDGLCLRHLRQGLGELALDYPHGARLLVKETLSRLEKEQVSMQEYIRKHNWEYREEHILPEESRAWRDALTFFSGFPPDEFQPFQKTNDTFKG